MSAAAARRPQARRRADRAADRRAAARAAARGTGSSRWGRAAARRAARTLIARLAGDRVGQCQIRLSALPGARERHRQCRRAGLADARVDELRRQQHVGVQPQIGERGVDERLGELPGSEVHQRGLEERPGAQHLAERHRIPPKQIQRALQFLLAVVQDRQHAVEFVQRGLELRPVVVDQSGYLVRHRRQVVHQRVDRITLRQKLGQQGVGVDDQLGDLIAALGQHRR